MKLKLAERICFSIVTSIAFPAFVVIGFWISGFDFDERGETALSCFVACVLTSFIGFVFTMMLTE